MKDQYEHIHYATDKKLSQRLNELSRRHVGDDSETLREAARRLEAYENRPETFNHEQFG